MHHQCVKCWFIYNVIISEIDNNNTLSSVDRNAYMEKKKERPPFLPEEKLPEPKKEEIPTELLCPLCKDLLTDAVLIPCCGTSFCDDCK